MIYHYDHIMIIHPKVVMSNYTRLALYLKKKKTCIKPMQVNLLS